jgi:protein-serine/threonine kinase
MAAVQSRSMKESHSLHLDEQMVQDDESGDVFGQFSSVTLHYDGD